MKLRFFLFLFLSFGICQADDDPPNLVLVLAPDLGCDWLGCYGAEHPTPHLDGIAEQGVRFETAWSMLEGELSHRTLLFGQYPASTAKQPPSFPELLVNSGYSREDFDFDREFQLPSEQPFLLLCRLPSPGTDFPSYVTRVDELVGALAKETEGENTLFLFTSSNGSAVGGTRNGRGYPEGKGALANWGAHVPLIIRAPFLSDGGRVSRDLVDHSDLYPTLLELAGIDLDPDIAIQGKSLVPSLRGSDDPFDKRNWISSQAGAFRMVRDWHHLLDTQGNFHDLEKDPLQEQEVSVQDKQAPHRRERLQMILDRFSSEDGPEAKVSTIEVSPRP